MAEQKDKKKKPLRSTSNTMRDLFDTYVKNSGPGKKMKNKEKKENKEQEVITEEVEKKPEDQEKEITTETKAEEIHETKDEDPMAKLKTDNAELKGNMLRLAAEMENIRKRTQKEKEDLIVFANERLLFQLLPIIDDFEAAIASGKKDHEGSKLLEGLEMIYNKSIKLLDNQGVKPMEDPTGQEFDVNLHEALLTMPSDMPEGHIAQVMQKGYMFHEKVLRHAKVATSQGKD